MGEGRALSVLADIVTPMAVRTAATLRIADHIAGGVGTVAKLAAVVGADVDALDRLLRHLVTVGILSEGPDGGYALTEKGEGLRDDHPSGLRPMLDVEAAVGRADLSFVYLPHSIRTGRPAFPEMYGREFWADVAADPDRSAGYDIQMGVDVSGDAPAIVSGYDWGALGHIMDVGGGNGSLLAAILRAYPGLRGTVFDQPDTAEAARRTLAAAGLDDRADAVGGSFFEPLPKGPKAYLLSAIIHDWDDESSITILRRCAEAAGPDGAVFVLERTGYDGESVSTGMDLRMLVYFGAKERGVTELSRLASRANLTTAAVHQAADISILELRPTP
ncbi:methyltransferase [Acrocarpospora catenulata]|uniref:methyltransferase n=1 Tax=Acrocarpospora catenulata TaxID=2836182 RepID=UPI001BDB22CD|nr:methyltransferase [Acrocarpospora catenulata]